MLIKRISLLLIVGLLIAFSGFSQTKQNKKRIAILGFKRFEFQSDYKLKEIMEINQLSRQDEVYELYLETILDELSTQTSQLSLFKLPKGERIRLQRRIPVKYKKKPASHLGVDMRYLEERKRMRTLLENMSADYLLVLTAYDIKQSISSKVSTSEGSTLLQWSTHHISYELYDKNTTLIIFGDQLKLKPSSPKKGTANTKGVDIELLKRAYQDILKDIEEKLLEKDRKD